MRKQILQIFDKAESQFNKMKELKTLKDSEKIILNSELCIQDLMIRAKIEQNIKYQLSVLDKDFIYDLNYGDEGQI